MQVGNSTITPPRPDLELWGGHECTVNRIGDRWFDQTIRSGHEHRPTDLALFADLGIRKLRYPALWERISPRFPEQADFDWTDDRLFEIRRLGMEPILTLCHHGSGPHYTSLVQDGFAPGLARHAMAVAERYPWVADYTPVNEPLTTARFSALYGFWYPHLRDEAAFWAALLNETDATRSAMRAIRRVNPIARLVQTDDLGFCHASELLKRSAEHQNQRRWMGWDLLCGMVVPGHSLWQRLVDFGLGDRLRTIADDPCPPDIIGVNHYLSSERFLDHRVDDHRDRASADGALGECDGVVHVDVDAVRHLPDEVIGLAGLIEQAWARYGIPIAVTECHNACTREEQARWFIEAWASAERLRGRGVDIRAVTAWSLLGSFDWDHMLTRVEGHYEPGVFDLRGNSPRATLMSKVLGDLAAGKTPSGPGLEVPGWWTAARTAQNSFAVAVEDLHAAPQYLMIVRGDCVPTWLTSSACEVRGLPYCLVDDLSAPMDAFPPWAVLDLRTLGVNSTTELSNACKQLGIKGAFFSLDRRVGRDTGEPNVLTVEHGPVFDADDDRTRPAILLDAFDAGIIHAVGPSGPWRGVYGPSLIDGVLDLLLDGATGHVLFTQPAVDLVSVLHDIVTGDRTSCLDTDADMTRRALSERLSSHLPSTKAMIERFIADRRKARGYRDIVDAGSLVEPLSEAAE